MVMGEGTEKSHVRLSKVIIVTLFKNKIDMKRLDFHWQNQCALPKGDANTQITIGNKQVRKLTRKNVLLHSKNDKYLAFLVKPA